jgi:hypothetical protein
MKGFEYTIKAIPTKYKGVLYRSRLEATWAAAFDGMTFSPSIQIPKDVWAQAVNKTQWRPS